MQRLVKFVKSIEPSKAFESAKIIFAVMGVGEVMGLLAATHLDLVFISGTLFAIAWYSIYRMIV